MSNQSPTAYIYQVTDRKSGRDYLTVAPSVDAAQAGIEERFNLPAGATKARAYKIDGLPARVFLHPLISGRRADVETEQCWAPTNKGDARCPNPARIGFHTCKIHTIVDIPAPFGTPEYESWISKPASPRKRRARATDAKTRADSSPAKPKPANRVSRARRKRRKP